MLRSDKDMKIDMNFISAFFDIAIILIVLLIIFLSYKKGFALSALGLAAWILALILSTTISGPASKYAYNYLESSFLGEANNYLSDSVNVDDNFQDKISYFCDSLPDITADAINFFGNTPEKISENVKENFASSSAVTLRNIVDISIKPVILSLLKSVFILIFFIILLPLFQLLAKIISSFFDLPVLSSVNKILGAFLGLFKAIVFVIVLLILLQVFIAATSNRNKFINTEKLESSYIFSLTEKYDFLSITFNK